MKYLIIVFTIYTLISCQSPHRDNNKCKKYYPNGKLMVSVDTVNTRFEGLLKFYDDKGHLLSSQEWKNGLPCGHFIFYNEKRDILYHAIDSVKTFKTVVDNDRSIVDLYDSNLVNFYSEFIKISLKKSLTVGVEDSFKVLNMPEYLLAITLKNGAVYHQSEQGTWGLKTLSDKNNTLTIYARTKEKMKQIKVIKIK